MGRRAVGDVPLTGRQINGRDFGCGVVRKLAMPSTAVIRVKKAPTGLNGGGLRSTAVLDAVAAFGFVIVECDVGEIDVATGDDLAILVGQLRSCIAIAPNL
jgi:hypothetical protein